MAHCLCELLQNNTAYLMERFIDMFAKQKHLALTIKFEPNYSVRKVFDDAEEFMLRDYLIEACEFQYGLSPKQARSLAYDFAFTKKKVYPDSWDNNQEAGVDWYRGFMRHHSDLSLRKPAATSLSRATSFNKHNVTCFFDNLDTDPSTSDGLPSSDDPDPSISHDLITVTPQSVCPHPKAPERKVTATKRKKGSTRILTDTPVKVALEKESLERQTKTKLIKKPTSAGLHAAKIKRPIAAKKIKQPVDMEPPSTAEAGQSKVPSKKKRPPAQPAKLFKLQDVIDAVAD
jgi:hypothetical protein